LLLIYFCPKEKILLLSAFHSSISNIPEQLEMYDEAELIRKSITHNNKVSDSVIKRGDYVRLLNKRGAFEKEG
jgi:hypothetical protein